MYIVVSSHNKYNIYILLWEVERMAISEAQKRAVAKYNNANYDKLTVRIKMGQRDILKAHAEEKGESLNGWIVSAIRDKLKQEKNN